MNVGTGGSLIQDIWEEVYGKSTVEDVIALGPEQWHNNPYRRLYPVDKIMGCYFHSLELSARSKFCAAMGFKTSDHPRILSSHHQAAGTLGKGLVAVATSRDGRIIEAFEHESYPNVLGIQFHPEPPALWDSEPRVREKPGDPLTSFNAILAGSPPSLPFNKAIWAWLAAKLKAGHGGQ
jgi:putative glutamine amidotransferase